MTLPVDSHEFRQDRMNDASVSSAVHDVLYADRRLLYATLCLRSGGLSAPGARILTAVAIAYEAETAVAIATRPKRHKSNRFKFDQFQQKRHLRWNI